MNHIANQYNSVVMRIFRDFSECISEKFNLELTELIKLLKAEFGVVIKPRNSKNNIIKMCPKCAEEGNENILPVSESKFCENHKRTNSNAFKIQLNRRYKIHWNPKTGFVPRSEIESTIIVGKIDKAGFYTQQLTEVEMAYCKRLNLSYEPGELPKQKISEKKNKKK